MSFPVALSQEHVIRLTRAATQAAPLEACGLLLGRTTHEERRVDRLTVARNLSKLPDQFFLDPIHLLRHEHAAASEDLEILGSWHSHLCLPAAPSHRDREGAPAQWVQLIAQIDDGVLTDLRAWDVHESAASEAKVFMDVDFEKDGSVGRPRPHGRREVLAGWKGSHGPLQA